MKPSYVYEHLVTFAETNLVGNVYFAHYLAWQGACREHFLAEHAPGVVARLSDDLALVTVSCACDYFAELFALDRVSIRMSLRETGGNRVAMDFSYYRVTEGPGQLIARGTQEIACMARADGQLHPVAVPAELSGALTAYAERP